MPWEPGLHLDLSLPKVDGSRGKRDIPGHPPFRIPESRVLVHHFRDLQILVMSVYSLLCIVTSSVLSLILYGVELKFVYVSEVSFRFLL